MRIISYTVLNHQKLHTDIINHSTRRSHFNYSLQYLNTHTHSIIAETTANILSPT